MSDVPFYAPDRKPDPPRQPRPGEHVWTMTIGSNICWAELRESAFGCELQILVNGELRVGHLHKDREWALAEAKIKRETLVVKGWAEETPI